MSKEITNATAVKRTLSPAALAMSMALAMGGSAGVANASCAPCNPCAAKKVLSDCLAGIEDLCNPCNPCAVKAAAACENPCNPCAAKSS